MSSEAPPQCDESPQNADNGFEDFFTSFLAKKKKTLTKKIDKIISLKASSAKLNQEQREMISREDEIRRQIQNYDDIRKLYMTAMSKQENDQSSWMTPEAKLRGLLALYMTQGRVPTDCHSAAELNKSYFEIFEASSLAESVRCGVRFTDNKALNNSLNTVVAEGKARGFKPHKPEQVSATQVPQPTEYEGEYTKAVKPHSAPRPPSKGHHQPKEAKQVNRLMQSDDEEEEQVVKPAVQSAKPKLALLPETMDEEAEQWIRMGPSESANRNDKRGRGPAAPRRQPSFPTQQPVPPQEKQEESTETKEVPAPPATTENVERKRSRENGNQRQRREKRAPKQEKNEYVRKA